MLAGIVKRKSRRSPDQLQTPNSKLETPNSQLLTPSLDWSDTKIMTPDLDPNSDAKILQIFLQPIFATPQYEDF